jgi:hypothetical protein
MLSGDVPFAYGPSVLVINASLTTKLLEPH